MVSAAINTAIGTFFTNNLGRLIGIFDVIPVFPPEKDH
jgi:hypothetical protein